MKVNRQAASKNNALRALLRARRCISLFVFRACAFIGTCRLSHHSASSLEDNASIYRHLARRTRAQRHRAWRIAHRARGIKTLLCVDIKPGGA